MCAALVSACLGLGLGAHAQKADAVRPEVGKPLQEAQGFMKSGRHREAMAKVNEADAVGNKSAFESYTIQRMRAAVATAAGDNDAAIRAAEAVINSGRASGTEARQMVQVIAVASYKNKDYPKAAQWTQRYFKEGGNDPAMRSVLLQSYYLGNDCAAVNKMLGSATEDNGKRPSEEELQILANCFLKQKDTGGYVAAIEKLVVYYPKKEYWTDLLSRVQKKPGFSDRLSLHVFRLRLETGNLSKTDDYLEMAQLALQAGYPAEAKAVVDKGYEAKALGTGQGADRHQRLRDLVTKSLEESQKNRAREEQEAIAAKDGNDLVKVGMNYVFEGKADKGLQLIDQGIKKGGLKRPEDAKLALGYAQVHAGQRAKGVQTLRTVQGTDGTADIARLWVLHARA
jgi:hypothetical protein